MDRGGKLCSVRRRQKIRLRLKEAFLVAGELAGKKVGSLIRLSQTYPSSASGNHPMAGTDFFSYFHLTATQ